MRSSIQVIHTGSKGNCCVIWDSQENGLLIDLGVSFPKVNKSIEYKISHICGAVVSHVHKDHAEYIPVFASNSVEVYSNANVREKYPECRLLGRKNTIGAFTVFPMSVPHDVPCEAFLVKTSDDVRILYITDTSGMKWLCKRVNYLIIECNYDADTIIDRKYNENYMTGSKYFNHSSLETCLDYIENMDKSELKGVILWHYSSTNLNKAKAKELAMKAAGIDNVVLAKSNLIMDMIDDNF